MRSFVACAVLLAACSSGTSDPPPSDGPPVTPPGPDATVDAAVSTSEDAAVSSATDAAVTPITDGSVLPGHDDLGPISGALNMTRVGAGLALHDLSIDQGGGLWWVTDGKVYYLPSGRATPFTYDQGSGLARGWSSWTTTYWCDPQPCSVSYPVHFLSVAGAMRGQAVIGNDGAIGDKLRVDSTSGNVISVDNMAVTTAKTADELAEHKLRVVTSWKAVADLNGTFHGTAYLGGRHGSYAAHGLTGDAGGEWFQEHQHYIDAYDVYGTDVRGLAITSMGDLWIGDRKMVSFLPQRSQGELADFFQTFTNHLDVWPGSYDEIAALAVDASDGLWVASRTHGLAYLAPGTLAITQFDHSNGLKESGASAVAVDGHGDVWVGFAASGLARYRPASRDWAYYTTADGLPSNSITNIQADRLSGAGLILVATTNGGAVIKP